MVEINSGSDLKELLKERNTFPCTLAYFKSLKSLTGEYIFGILIEKIEAVNHSF
jgi:hypothetical protein